MAGSNFVIVLAIGSRARQQQGLGPLELKLEFEMRGLLLAGWLYEGCLKFDDTKFVSPQLNLCDYSGCAGQQ